MKKAVFLFLLLLSFISIEAQATPSNCYWGYCNNKVTGEFGGKKAAKGAIYIPSEVAQMYKGKTGLYDKSVLILASFSLM